MKRKATALWEGSIKDGKGYLNTQSQVLDKTQYSFKSRFEEGKGTNPEELIGAAHAGCFAMQLSANLTEEGFDPEELEATAAISLENKEITSSHLVLKAKVPGISREQFEKLVTHAKENCPVSKLLKADITMDLSLDN